MWLEVDWIDALGGRGWEDDVTVEEPIDLMRTHGYLVDVTDDYVILAQNVHILDDEVVRVGQVMFIPIGCIKKFREVK